MQLYFIRHAQSKNNALYIETGTSDGRSEDPELSVIGYQQIQYLAKFITETRTIDLVHNHDPQNGNGFGLTHLYTSLMQRAIITGCEVSRATGLELIGHPDLHETGGIYLNDPDTDLPMGLPGKTGEELRKIFPDLVLPDTVKPYEGWWNRDFETREQRLPRAKRFLDFILDRHGNTDDRVAVFSHAGFYNYFLTALLGLSERPGIWFEINNTGITRIDFRETEVSLVFTNRTDFLPPDLVS